MKSHISIFVILTVVSCLFIGCGGQDGSAWNGLSEQSFKLFQEKKFKEAMVKAKESLSLAKTAFGEKNEKTSQSYSYLARLYQATGQMADAEIHYKKAIDILDEVYPEPHYDTAKLLNHYAVFLAQQQRYLDAEKIYLRSMDITKKVLGPKNPEVGKLHMALGNLYRSQAEHGKSAESFRQAIEIFEGSSGPHHPTLAIPLNSLGLAQAKLGLLDESEKTLNKALKLLERNRWTPTGPRLR